MKHLFLFIFLLILPFAANAAETIPPRPTQYVTDAANILSAATTANLEKQLTDFDKQTSNQILVAIYPKMQSDSSIDDYTLRIANQWKAGSKKYDNGAILFVFVQNRKMFIQVGYGLEGALPDALCKRIIDQEIAPHFKQGDYNGGIAGGVQAIMAATRGEYKGHPTSQGAPFPWVFFTIFLIIVIISIISRIRRYSTYGPMGGGRSWYMGPMIGGFGGGGFGGGGGGGGGFGAGGGGFGGGGAGGSW